MGVDILLWNHNGHDDAKTNTTTTGNVLTSRHFIYSIVIHKVYTFYNGLFKKIISCVSKDNNMSQVNDICVIPIDTIYNVGQEQIGL